MILKNIFGYPKELVSAHNGIGEIEFCRVLTDEDFASNCDFVDYAVLPEGTSIGIHTHGNDEEIYFILSGKGLMTVNEKEFEVREGNVILNKPGWSHGLYNPNKDSLTILVVQIHIS